MNSQYYLLMDYREHTSKALIVVKYKAKVLISLIYTIQLIKSFLAILLLTLSCWVRRRQLRVIFLRVQQALGHLGSIRQ